MKYSGYDCHLRYPGLPKRFRGACRQWGLSVKFVNMLTSYTISFRFTKPTESKPGPIQRYVLRATSLSEAEEQARRYANYPNIEVISVRES